MSNTDKTIHIGFIGLGMMGSGMLFNAIKRLDWELVRFYIYNRTRTRAEDFVANLPPKMQELVVICDTPREVANHATRIFICVSDSDDVEAVATGKHGLFRGTLAAGSIIVDHSTISVETCLRMAEYAQKHEATWLDAPITGGSEGAEKGTLTVMMGGKEVLAAGGERTNFDLAKDVIHTYADKIVPFDQSGEGLVAKFANQISVVGCMYAAAEAFGFGKQAGLDLNKLHIALSGGAGSSWMLENRMNQVLRNFWAPGFSVDLQAKDLRLVLDHAEQLNLSLEMTEKIYDMYAYLQQQGKGAEGNQALYKVHPATHDVRT